jgi:hypothetical protein
MVELVKWSFTLPILAILLSLTVRWIVIAIHSILKTVTRGLGGDREAEMFRQFDPVEIARLRARTHAH